MRIGIYGGSFNPPHLGHVFAAKQIIDRLSLDKLIVIPACFPPHKNLAEGTPSPEIRFRLTRLAFSDIPQAEVSDMEIIRKGVSYTADTVAQIREIFPKDDLFLLMGTDMFTGFSKWYHPDYIASQVTLVVMDRYSSALAGKMTSVAEELQNDFRARIVFADNRINEISSTEIRRMLTFGCADSLLDPRVWSVIMSDGLYNVHDVKKGLSFNDLLTVSLAQHDSRRIPHVIGCCETAVSLAERWNSDKTAASKAAALHDITKALSVSSQMLLCGKYSIELSPAEEENSKLLHAKTAAAVAEYVFEEPEDVCSAVKWHTTGRPGMSLLEKVIYLADYVEPNRDFDGVEKIRELAFADIDAAMQEGLALSVRILTERNKTIDPNSLEALKYYTERNKAL